MLHKNRLFVTLVLVFALIVQALPITAQEKVAKSGGSNSSTAADGTDVAIKKLRLVGTFSAQVDWDVALPAGVEVQGFDVKVEADLSTGQKQTSTRSFGGDARTGLFDFKLTASDGASNPLLPNPKPGKAIPGTGSKSGDKSGGIGNNNGGNTGGGNGVSLDQQKLCETDCAKGRQKAVEFQKCVAACLKGSSGNNNTIGGPKEKEKSARKLGEGNISGGGKNTSDPVGSGVGSNNNNNDGTIKPIVPKPIIPKPVDPKPADPKPTPKPDAVRITGLRAFITAKFAVGNDLAAFREFIQPANKITGELTPKNGRGSSLQVSKLIHISEVAALARECPAGQDCFDVIAELRGANAAGQFKVSLEVLYPNGIRKTTSRAITNLLRPIRLSVDKPAGAQMASALVNINGGGNGEAFTKNATKGIAILQGLGK
jgi:hypothetical protein